MRAAVSGRAVTGHDPRARRSSGIVARTSLDLRLVPLDVLGVQWYSTYMKKGTGTWYTMKGTTTGPSDIPGYVNVYRCGKFIASVKAEAGETK